LTAGKLVECLEQYRLSPVCLNAIFLAGARASTNGELFADFMAEQLRVLDRESDWQGAA
jgi:hypothetical protein